MLNPQLLKMYFAENQLIKTNKQKSTIKKYGFILNIKINICIFSTLKK